MTEHITTNKQSLFDVAKIRYGNIDGVFELLKCNDVDLLSPLQTSTVIQVPEWDGKNAKIVEYFQKNEIEIATDLKESLWLLSEGLWNDEKYWFDNEFWKDS